MWVLVGSLVHIQLVVTVGHCWRCWFHQAIFRDPSRFFLVPYNRWKWTSRWETTFENLPTCVFFPITIYILFVTSLSTSFNYRRDGAWEVEWGDYCWYWWFKQYNMNIRLYNYKHSRYYSVDSIFLIGKPKCLILVAPPKLGWARLSMGDK